MVCFHGSGSTLTEHIKDVHQRSQGQCHLLQQGTLLSCAKERLPLSLLRVPCPHLAESLLGVVEALSLEGRSKQSYKSFLAWHQSPAFGKTELRVDSCKILSEFPGNVTNPKAIKEDTSNRMLICPLCNNVTKILMIHSYNLRFRINGFDVWLALLHTVFGFSEGV